MICEPMVSVVMPAFNASRTIAESIMSVIEQGYQDWELIIVDDGSVDSTGEIVGSFNDPRIIYLKQSNRGVAAARNSAIKKATGKYIAFLDADDLWNEEKLASQVDFMESNEQRCISHTGYKSFVDSRENVIENKLFYPFAIKSDLERLLVFNYLATLTVMVKRETLERVGFFDETYMGAEDWELWTRVLLSGCAIGYIEKELAFYREGTSGLSKNREKQLVQEFRVLQNHVLKTNKYKYLQKKALWFLYAKKTNYYISNKMFLEALGSYAKLFCLCPLKPSNFSLPFRKILFLFWGTG